MKKVLVYALAFFCGAGIFTSCSDDDPENKPIAGEKVYTGESLDIDYSGEDVEGMSVKFVNRGDKADLTIYSEFDLSEIPGGGMSQVVAGPGLIPGSAVTTLTVDLVDKGNGVYTFAGKSGNDYCTYSYSGSVDANKLELDITDVKTGDKALAGTSWKVAPYVESEEVWGEVLSRQLHIVWESDVPLTIDLGEGNKMTFPMGDLLNLVAYIPLIPSEGGEDMSVATALEENLREVSFRTDGNIVARYMEGNKVETSPLNLARYVVPAPNRMLLFLNPRAIAKDVESEGKMRAGGQDILMSVTQALAVRLLPMLSEGVALNYSLEGDKLMVCVPTEVLLPLLKEVLLPVLKDEAFMKYVLEEIAKDESMGEMAPLIESVLKSLPEVIEKTTKLELGVNFEKIK